MIQKSFLMFVLIFGVPGGGVFAQDAASGEVSQETPAVVEQDKPSSVSKADEVKKKLNEEFDKVADSVDKNEQAQQARDSLLKPIYEAAEYLAQPWFHWVAFAMMVAGLVSFGLQLVLGKLVMLLQFHFSLTEILADGLGFLISVIGLILTTQAATENSNFTESSALVLSSAIVGLVFGVVFYIRGQTQELRELREVRRRKQ